MDTSSPCTWGGGGGVQYQSAAIKVKQDGKLV